MMAGDPCVESVPESTYERETYSTNSKTCEKERDQYLHLLRTEVQKALSLELRWKAYHEQSEKKWEAKLQKEFDENE